MPPLGIARFQRIPRFKKSYRKLNDRTQRAVDEVIQELLLDEMPPGRNLEKNKSVRNVWTVRVSQGYRLSFEVDGNIAILRNVGSHGNLYGNP